MKNYRLHFIRHGLTGANRQGAYAGRRTDVELAPEGIGGVLYPQAELQVVPAMAEMDFGEFDGLTLEDLGDREDYRRWLQNSLTEAPPGGESMEEFGHRVAVGLSSILAYVMKEQVQDTAIVTHGGVIRAVLSAMALPRLDPGQMMVGNGRGYTCFVTPQLWMRDRVIEVAGVMPHGAASAAVLNPELAALLEKADQRARGEKA